MNKFLVKNHRQLKSTSLQKMAASTAFGAQILRRFFALVCVAAAGLLSIPAIAADTSGAAELVKSDAQISVSLKHFKVVLAANGETKYLNDAVVVPGDVIEYRATYLNRAAKDIVVVATLPIPESMEYLKNSASANKQLAHSVATKDAQFANEPLVREVATASGATLSQPIPYASYRYVRWDLGKLAPGNAVELSVRAKVSQYLEGDVSVEDKASILAASLPKK